MLKSIEIQNFRSCKRTSLSIESPLCALVGKNGAGKTNVLEAINWIAGTAIRPDAIKLDALSATSPFEFSLVASLGEATYEYRIAFESIGQLQGKEPVDSLVERLENATTRTVLFDRHNENVDVTGVASKVQIGRSTPALSAIVSLLPEGPLRAELKEVRGFFSAFGYYPTHEIEVRKNFFVTDEEYASWRQGYAASGLLPDSTLMRLLYLEREEGDSMRAFQNLAGRNGLGLVDFSGFQQMGAPDSPAKFNVALFEPLEGLGGAGQKFFLPQLSQGTRRIIGLIAALLFDKRAVMLIEEPDDSIHPGLVGKLLDLWRSYFKQTNLIITSHSPYLLDLVKPNEIRLVTATHGRTDVRGLSPTEIDVAGKFLREEGKLSEYLQGMDE